MENQTKQQTTNLNTKSNRIFAVDCGYFYGFCKIVEFEIVKETPNQIVAAPVDKSTLFSTSERTIKKSTMECCGLKFARTYEEAVKTQINLNMQRDKS